MPELTTFVFTDLVGSVDLKGRMPGPDAAARDEAYVRLVLTPHRERIEARLAEHGGRVVSTAGDGHFLAFSDTSRAALWAIETQRSHARPLAEGELAENRVRVRMGLHIGPPQTDPDDPNNYIGRAVDYAARLADYAAAEQILASRSAASLLEDAGLADVALHSHGLRELRGIGDVELFEVVYANRQPTEPRKLKGEKPDRRTWTVLPATMGLTEYGASLSSAAAPPLTAQVPPAKQLGNYELGERIGAGGMGIVYRARHKLFGRTRAVKVIKPELVAAGGESIVRRFYQEVKATGALEHPNLVVAIDSSAPGDDQHYLVMEYIDGVGLDQVLLAEGRLAREDACEIARQAAFGLEHLYQQGLVHRDVKPSNLMLTLVADPQGSTFSGKDFDTESPMRPVAKLMDLGLALLTTGDQQRVTQMNQGGMGTGHYMSPEQWRTTSVDIRADIYSLGCTLYHLLSGEPPFADSDLRPEKAHQREPLPRLERAEGVPAALADLLNRMMAKRPEDRPQSPLEVARVLTPLAEGHRVAELIERCRQAKGKPSMATTHRAPRWDASGDTRTSPRADGIRDGEGSQGSTLAGKVRWLAPSALLVVALVAASLFAWMANERRQQTLGIHRRSLTSSSQLAADLMAEQIEKRFRALEGLAKQSKIADWLIAIRADAENAEKTKSQEAYRSLQSWIDNQKLQNDELFNSSSWFLTDDAGIQVARSPKSDSIGKSYAHRDYFHGELEPDEKETGDQPPAPIDRSHQSTVYRSSSTGALKVAFSVPVFASDRSRQVVGVLAMSVSLGEFTALRKTERALEPIDHGGKPIEIVLADTSVDYTEGEAKRGLILHHRDLERFPSETPFRLPEALLKEVQKSRKSHFLGEYGDLFGRTARPYWGASAPIVISNQREKRTTNWVIIAQEPLPY